MNAESLSTKQTICNMDMVLSFEHTPIVHLPDSNTHLLLSKDSHKYLAPDQYCKDVSDTGATICLTSMTDDIIPGTQDR